MLGAGGREDGFWNRVNRASSSRTMITHKAKLPEIAHPIFAPRYPLSLVAQPVETLLHLFHLALEVVDVVATAFAPFRARRACPASLPLARERREHRKGALEHLHVPPHLIFHRAEAAHAEGLRNLLAELLPAPS